MPIIPKSSEPPVEDEKRRYWDQKGKLEFQRMAMQGAVKACAVVMAAAIQGGTEPVKFSEAMATVETKAKELYNGLFKILEGPEPF